MVKRGFLKVSGKEVALLEQKEVPRLLYTDSCFRFGVTIYLPSGIIRQSQLPTLRPDTAKLLIQGQRTLTFSVRQMNFMLLKLLFVGYFVTYSQKNF